ncbi:hypothetical protein EDB89DRAFT_1403957 [Lactarius sanguifluus]|nr:hypothetical protein EDB89DRAFT_1403957 [Lactarius sanguifluus]
MFPRSPWTGGTRPPHLLHLPLFPLCGILFPLTLLGCTHMPHIARHILYIGLMAISPPPNSTNYPTLIFLFSISRLSSILDRAPLALSAAPVLSVAFLRRSLPLAMSQDAFPSPCPHASFPSVPTNNSCSTRQSLCSRHSATLPFVTAYYLQSVCCVSRHRTSYLTQSHPRRSLPTLASPDISLPMPATFTLPSHSLPATSCNVSRCAFRRLHPSVTFAALYLLQRLKTRFAHPVQPSRSPWINNSTPSPMRSPKKGSKRV